MVRQGVVRAAIILAILNDAWRDNWGFVPFTESEIAFAGKKMKPIIFNDLVRIESIRLAAVAGYGATRGEIRA